MPRSTWLIVAAIAATLVLVVVVDPLGMFGAGSDDGRAPDALPDDLLTGPELAGRGDGDSNLELTEFEGDPVGVIDLRMGAGTLTGVVTGDGEPLELARVGPVLPPPFSNFAVRTRKDGTWEIRGLSLAQHELRVGKEGWRSKTVVAPMLIADEAAEGSSKPASAEAAVEPIDLVRRPDWNNALVVTAMDMYGRPIPKAQVLATTLEWDLHLNMGPDVVGAKDVFHKSGSTDETGKCRLNALPPERYNVVVSAPGYQTTPVARVLVAEGRTRSVPVRMPPGSSIEGVVQDAEGKPVADAYVGGLAMGVWQSSLSTRSDANGRFVLDDLRKGTYMIFGYDDDLGEAQSQSKSPGVGAVLKLAGTGKLTVKAVYADGEPVTRARVRVFQATSFNFGQLYSMAHSLDDPNGELELKLAGGPYKVRVQSEGGLTSADVTAEVTVGDKLVVEVTVPKTGVVKGVVVDDSGNHIAGAEVYVRIGGFPPIKSRERYARTDEDGAFEVVGLDLEPVGLHVSHAEYADMVYDATPRLAGTSNDVTITMPTGAIVQGHVRDPEGRPIAGEQITVVEGMDWTSALIAFTDGSGAYRIEGVPEGTWQVRQGAFESQSLGVTKTATVGGGGTVTVDFDLASGGGSVTGVVRSGGAPLAGAVVTVTDSRGLSNQVTAKTDENGQFVAQGIQPGAFRAYVETDGGLSATQSGSFEEGSTTATITIDLGTSGVRGRVIDLTGEPIANAWLTVELVGESDDNDWSRVKATRTTDAEGRFAAVGIGAGTYQLRINSGAHAQNLTDPFQLADGATLDVGDITLQTAVLLSGRVTDDTGAPVEDATIAIEDAAGRPVFLFSMSTTGSDGRYSVQGLKEGRYKVKFEARGYSPFEAAVELGAGGATKDGVLARGGAVRVVAKDEGGYPVGGARVQLLDGQGRAVRWTLSMVNLFDSDQSYTNADGVVDITDLAAGTYRVKVESEGWVVDGQPMVVVSPGQTSTAEVGLRKP